MCILLIIATNIKLFKLLTNSYIIFKIDAKQRYPNPPIYKRGGGSRHPHLPCSHAPTNLDLGGINLYLTNSYLTIVET